MKSPGLSEALLSESALLTKLPQYIAEGGGYGGSLQGALSPCTTGELRIRWCGVVAEAGGDGRAEPARRMTGLGTHDCVPRTYVVVVGLRSGWRPAGGRLSRRGCKLLLSNIVV